MLCSVVLVYAGFVVRWLPKLKGESEVEGDQMFDDKVYWEVSEGVCVWMCVDVWM